MTNFRFADTTAASGPVVDWAPANATENLEALIQDEHKILARAVLALRRGPIRYCRDQTIVIEGEPSEYILLVISGVVRTFRSFQDGTRSIVAFHLPGELVGLTNHPTHSLTTEAAADAMILFFKRSSLLSIAEQESHVANFLLSATLNELRRAQDHSLLVKRGSKCRFASFLIDLSIRMGTQEYLKLPMSYGDVADHLGLTIETISRVITRMQTSGLIARGGSSRLLILKNRNALARMAN
jgi:CRP/FNR family transcriptional regulator, nitrogen fixation regulation protein